MTITIITKLQKRKELINKSKEPKYFNQYETEENKLNELLKRMLLEYENLIDLIKNIPPNQTTNNSQGYRKGALKTQGTIFGKLKTFLRFVKWSHIYLWLFTLNNYFRKENKIWEKWMKYL